jgi:hypothetical protein
MREKERNKGENLCEIKLQKEGGNGRDIKKEKRK